MQCNLCGKVALYRWMSRDREELGFCGDHKAEYLDYLKHHPKRLGLSYQNIKRITERCLPK